MLTDKDIEFRLKIIRDNDFKAYELFDIISNHSNLIDKEIRSKLERFDTSDWVEMVMWDHKLIKLSNYDEFTPDDWVQILQVHPNLAGWCPFFEPMKKLMMLIG